MISINKKRCKKGRIYVLDEWKDYSDLIKKRDNFTCQKCERQPKDGAILQVHHISYIEGQKPWEYPTTQCLTLCKGCHAREHGLLQADRGWLLVQIDDLGDINGKCEREEGLNRYCDTAIRYEHLAYHPKHGYMTVGSTCITFLTEADKKISEQFLKIHSAIDKFFIDALKSNIRKLDIKKIGYDETYILGKKYKISIYRDKKTNQYKYKLAKKTRNNKYFYQLEYADSFYDVYKCLECAILNIKIYDLYNHDKIKEANNYLHYLRNFLDTLKYEGSLKLTKEGLFNIWIQ